MRDTLNLETRPEPSYRILLEMMQPDLLQAGKAGNCTDEEVSQLVCSTPNENGKNKEGAWLKPDKRIKMGRKLQLSKSSSFTFQFQRNSLKNSVSK